jgi:hypothetical protein
MTEDGFDSDAFRAEATGETTSATESHAAAEGTEPSSDVGSTSTLREMLMSTSPSKSLEETENPWDPDRGGPTRIYRGIMKAVDVDGMPAAADIMIGLAETFDAVDLEDVDAGDDQDDEPEVADLA